MYVQSIVWQKIFVTVTDILDFIYLFIFQLWNSNTFRAVML